MMLTENVKEIEIRSTMLVAYDMVRTNKIPSGAVFLNHYFNQQLIQNKLPLKTAKIILPITQKRAKQRLPTYQSLPRIPRNKCP